MCWNRTVSLNTFILSVAAALLAWNSGFVRNDRSHVLFVLVYSSMQLVEWAIWYSLETDNKALNALAGRLGLTVLGAELFAAANVAGTPIAFVVAAMSIFAINITSLLSRRTTRLFAPSSSILSSPSPVSGHLRWGFLDPNPVSVGIFVVTMIGLLAWGRAWWLVGLTVLTFAIAVRGFWRDQTWGSMWCWLSALASLFIIVREIFFFELPKSSG